MTTVSVALCTHMHADAVYVHSCVCWFAIEKSLKICSSSIDACCVGQCYVVCILELTNVVSLVYCWAVQ